MKLSGSYALFFMCTLFLLSHLMTGSNLFAGQKTITLGVVDLSLIIAFHPAMRDFDHRAGMFVSTPDSPPAPGGKKVLEENTDLYYRIIELEKNLERQIELINDRMVAFISEGTDIEKSSEAITAERAKLVDLRRQHSAALAEMVGKATAEFPQSGYDESPDEKKLEGIMHEILYYIQTVAQKHDAVFVFNSASGPFAGRGPVVPPRGQATITPEQILEKWAVKNIADLQALLEKEGSITGAPTPAENKNLPCGGHFESLTDKEYLETLFFEYYDARQAFTAPFLNFRGGAFLLYGSAAITELDLTREVLEQLFERHKVQKAARDAAYSVLSKLNKKAEE